MGAVSGGAIGASERAGPFDPLVEPVKAVLPTTSSALILVAEPKTTEELVSAVGARSRQVLRQDLTDEQVAQLKQAAVRRG